MNQNNEKLHHWLKNRKQMLMLSFLAVIILVQVIRLGNYPGLNLDSIKADYMSAPFINFQKYTSSEFGFIGDFQLIGTLYHGNLTMFWTLFISLLTGTSSVIQYHIGNAGWLILCLAGMQYFLYKQKVNSRIVFFVLLLISISPSCISTVFTQDYSFLPGTAFLIFSIINILKWREEEYNYHVLFIAFFWLGLAIYSYAVYAIYYIVLAIICCILSEHKKIQNYYKILFCAGAGGLAGAFFYIIGFYSILYSFIDIYSDTVRCMAFLLTVIAIICINCFGYCLSLKDACYIKKFLWAGVNIIIVLFPIAYNWKYVPSFRGELTTRIENILFAPLDILDVNERIHKLSQRLTTIYSNPAREVYVLGETVSRFSNVLLVSFLLVILMWLIFRLIAGKKFNDQAMFILLGSQLGYIVLSFLLIIGGLNQGHCTTLFFVSFLILALACSDLLKMIDNSKEIWKAVIIKKGLIGLLCLNLTINFINTGTLANRIIKTGGHGTYTHQLTVLAQEALEARANGKQEIYFFPEWGFATSFIYLTGNTVPLRQSVVELKEINMFKQFKQEGFTIFIVAFFDEKNVDEYLACFSEGREKVQKEIRYTRDGEYGFTILKLELE